MFTDKNDSGFHVSKPRHVLNRQYDKAISNLLEHQSLRQNVRSERIRRLTELRREYVSHRRQIIGRSALSGLRQFKSTYKRYRGTRLIEREVGPDVRLLQGRERNMVRLAYQELARDFQVNLDALGRLGQDTRRLFDKIVPFEAALPLKVYDAPAPPIAWGFRTLPYDGWDYVWESYGTGSTWTHLSPEWAAPLDHFVGVAGQNLEMGNPDASDADIGWISHDGGMLIWVSQAHEGPIEAIVELQCNSDKYTISAEDEYGISDSSIWVGDQISFGVYSEYGYSTNTYDLFWRNYWGAPPSSWGGDNGYNPYDAYSDSPYSAGQALNIHVVTPESQPANQPLLLHAGVLEYCTAFVNDVSFHTSASSRWLIKSMLIKA